MGHSTLAVCESAGYTGNMRLIVCVGTLLHVQFTSRIRSILWESLSTIYRKSQKALHFCPMQCI